MSSVSHEPKVSVVTPAYNVGEYLRECIESVLAQSYTNWDYTIVNNASTDNTLQIAEEFAARDSRIRVVSNDVCVPVIENHNIAVRQCSSDSRYCKVLAGDDWLNPDFLRLTVGVAERHPSVAIVCTFALDNIKVRYTGLPFPGEFVPGREVCRNNLLGGPYVFGLPSSSLYRADIVRIRDRFYNENNLHADTEVCFEYLQDNDFGFVHQVLAYIRPRDNTTTSHADDFDTYLSGWLLVLVRYGSSFLSERELSQRLKSQLQQYRQFLGREYFKKRGRDFWDFHLRKLAELGHPISRWQIMATGVQFIAASVFLHPVRTTKKLF